MSVTNEIPSVKGLKLLAPDKNRADFIKPMEKVENEINQKKFQKSTPIYAPEGQGTQLIIGTTDEIDAEIMSPSATFYKNYNLKQVYYSGYIPIRYNSSPLNRH